MESLLFSKIDNLINDLLHEKESAAYNACQFSIGGNRISYRKSKTTPKKAGQFVTFWKRSVEGPIAPFHETDKLDFFLVESASAKGNGFFLLPKSILLLKGILSTESKEGKRAFRVYPPWCIDLNKTAKTTQKWQLKYFYDSNEVIQILHKK